MPLIKPVEELLKQITDESDRKALLANFEKYDFLQKSVEGNLRQQDYDRFMNETKAARQKEQDELKAARDYNQSMKDWAEKNIPKHTELQKNYGELEAKYRTLEETAAAATAAAAARAEGEGTPVDEVALLKKVTEEIAKKGYVTPADIPGIVATETKKAVTEQVTQQANSMRENFYKTDVPGVIAFVTAMNELQFKNREEFGTPLDTKEFAKYIAENKIEDPYKAYDQFTATARTEKREAQLTKDITEKVEKEYASKHNLPGSGAPPAHELGPVQMDRMKKTPYIPESAVAGDNQLAYAAAAELRNEGKF